QIRARLTGLLAQFGRLADREAHVLRGDQRVRLGGDLGQFGNDFLLLGQIESHCTPPYFDSARCGCTAAVLQRHRLARCRDTARCPLVPFPGNLEGRQPSTQARSRRTGLSGPVGGGGDSLPAAASLPTSATRGPRLRSLTAIAPEHRDNRPQNPSAARTRRAAGITVNVRARGSPGPPARRGPWWS